MPDKPSEDRFKDIPALANPTTPSLRRLRARLEGRTPAQTRKTKPKDSTAEPSEVPQSTEVKSDPMAANTTPVQDLPDEPAQVETKPFKLRLTKPHSLITQTQELEQRQRRGEWAYLSRDPWPGVASGVSKGQKRIALAVMDRLFKVLETGGMRVELCDGPRRRGAHAVDGRDKTPLEITEEHRETPHVPTEQELKKKERDPYYRIPKKDVLPTGQLILAPGGRVDLSSEAALEAVLAKAVAEVKESLAEARTSREAAEQRRDEEWRREQEQRAEKARIEALHQAASNLHRYRLLMDYIEEVRRFGWVPDDQRKEGQSLDEWLRWAEWKARCIHPLG